jgi:hypothetical protein
VYWTHETSSYELYGNEFRGVSDGLISMWGDGAWTASVQNETAGIEADSVVTPRIADGVTDDLYPDHITGWGLSRQLVDDVDRLGVAIDVATMIVGPEGTIPFFENHSSVCASKDVYNAPEIARVQWGPLSRDVATGVWPRARYNGDHVEDMGPAWEQLDGALRGAIGPEEALSNMDAYCQAEEDAAREQIAG